MCRTTHLRLLLLVGALLSPSLAYATQQVVVGATYGGQISRVDGPGCDAPGTVTFSGTLRVTNVSGLNFDAVFTGADALGTTTAQLNLLSGVLDGLVGGCVSPGNCPFSSTDGSSGDVLSVSGTISQQSVSISGSFSQSSPNPSCSGSFSYNGAAQVVINPATSSSSVQVQQGDAQAALSPTGVVGEVAGYAANLNRQRTGGGQRVTANSLRLSSRGLSAGDHMDVPFGVWIAGAYSISEDDSTAPFESDRINLTGGVDVTMMDDLVVGLALGLETADTKTSANNGQVDSYGFTVAPYVAYLIDDALSVDFAVGYSRLSHDQARGAQRAITSDTNSNRVFVAGNGNWGATYGNWYLSARGGITWLSSELDRVTESDGTVVPESVFRVGQVSLGGEAAYSYDEWEPYLGATFNHAYSKTRRQFAGGITPPEDDRTDLLLNAGVRFFGANGVSGGVEYSTLLLRDDFTEHSFQFNVRAEF